MTSSPKLFNTAMAVYACAACIVSAHASPLQSSRKLLSQQEQETIQETIHLGHALFNSGKLADFKITRSLGLPIIETDSLHINAEELKSAYDKVSGDSEEDGELENVELPERSAEESSRRRKMLDTGEKLTQFMQGFSEDTGSDESGEGDDSDSNSGPDSEPKTFLDEDSGDVSTEGGSSCSDAKVLAMIDEDNVERGKIGLNMLECNDRAAQAAYEWSVEMCKIGIEKGDDGMSHVNFDQNCENAGLMPCAENLAWHSPHNFESTVENTHINWMESDGHRENIEREGMDVVGYGWFPCEDGRMYWTGLFGVPN